MTQGIFALSFESENQQLGKGFAAFIDGKIRGGDVDFVYDGAYQLGGSNSPESNQFTATVAVQYYKGINLAIFGKMTRFPIELSGVFTADGLLAHGKIKKFGSEEVDLKGSKVDNLQLEILAIDEWRFSDQIFNSENESIHLMVSPAITLYKNNCYIDATNIVLSVIKSVIFYLLKKRSRKNVQDITLLDGLDILIEDSLISPKMKSLLQILITSDDVLNKKRKSPEDCAFPLCIIAFSLLDELLKLQMNNDQKPCGIYI